MKWVKQILSYVVLLGTMGCAGQVLQDSRSVNLEDRRVDGGILGYFLPKGLLKVTAGYDPATGIIKISHEQSVVADFEQRHTILYSHVGLSNDQINIVTEAGMLKSISSTTQDQTVELVKKFNAILSEFSTLSTAIRTDDAEKKVVPTSANCQKPVSIAKSYGLTYFKDLPEKLSDVRSDKCWLELKVDRVPADKLDARFFPVSGEMLGPKTCDRVVCFRLTGAFTTRITAILRYDDVKDQEPAKDVTTAHMTAELLAPAEYPLGFIRFGRRAFVTNSTTATFTNGVLTAINTSDPSEVIGFLSIPVDLLKSLTILVKL